MLENTLLVGLIALSIIFVSFFFGIVFGVLLDKVCYHFWDRNNCEH